MVHTGLPAIPMTKNTGSVVHTDTLTLQSSLQHCRHGGLPDIFEIPPNQNVTKFVALSLQRYGLFFKLRLSREFGPDPPSLQKGCREPLLTEFLFVEQFKSRQCNICAKHVLIYCSAF